LTFFLFISPPLGETGHYELNATIQAFENPAPFSANTDNVADFKLLNVATMRAEAILSLSVFCFHVFSL
jgi:hypothetical protein